MRGSAAEAPEGNIVPIPLYLDVSLPEGRFEDVAEFDPAMADAFTRVTDLAPEEDIQVTLFNHLGAQPPEVGAMISCFFPVSMPWLIPKLKEPAFNSNCCGPEGSIYTG